MAAGTNIDTKNNMIMQEFDIGQDVDDIVGWVLEEEDDLIDIAEEDPLLTLTPIVVTTKMDEMRTIDKDLTDLNAKEIIKMINAESKPKLKSNSKIKKAEKSVQISSFTKISTFIHSVNFKSRLKTHTTYVRNLNLWNQCKPCSVKLIDYRKIPPKNIAETLPDDSPNKPLEILASTSSKVKVKTETINNPDNICEVKVKLEVIDISDDETVSHASQSTENNKKKTRCETKESASAAKKSKTIESHNKTNEYYSSANKLKTITTQNKNSETVSSAKKTKSKENRSPSRLAFESSDEEDTALVHLKKKPAPAFNSIVGHQNYLEKYGLIVLLKMNKEEACVYRVNVTKLVTDFYLTSAYNEYKLASMYPKEEKIVEHYCCWHKREEIVTKICSRKNYPFTIQKFLRVPHSCHPGDCQCCCFNTYAGKSKEPRQKRRAVVNKSIDLAESWIRSLLERNQDTNIGLVAKAMSYIPKPQLKEKVEPSEPEKCLENVLLWLNYTGGIDTFKHTCELYVIGNNSHLLATYLFDDKSDIKANKVRQTYASLHFGLMETKFCCWYNREEALLKLRAMAKVPHVAIKLMQLSHPCARNYCRCCCKPDNILQLKADIDILPPTINLTTAYEKDVHPLTIRFKVNSKTPLTLTKSKNLKISKNADVSLAAAVLSDCANKLDKEELSVSILSNFKNIKIDLDSNGELKVIVNTPAKNLTKAEYRRLLEILTLSLDQTKKIGITAEEFCKRIRDKSYHPSTYKTSTTHKKSQPAFSASKNIETITPEITTLNEKEVRQDHVPSTEKTILLNERMAPSPTYTFGKLKLGKTPTITKNNNNQVTGKLVSNIFTSLSNLMEKKNKSYVDSFKTFFINKVTTVVTIPEIDNKFKIPPLKSKETPPLLLPKIADSFTLAKPYADATAGPSNPTKPCENTDISILKASSSTRSKPSILRTYMKQSNTKNNKRKDDSDTDNISKRIRVKDPSELLPATIPMQIITTQLQMMTTAQAPISTTVTNPVPVWPVPITIKQEPQLGYQQIAIPQQPVLHLNPNLQAQPGTFYIAAGTVPNMSTGACLLALTPMQVSNVNSLNLKPADNTMLAQIINHPQVQPFPVAANSVPPLVPLRPAQVPQSTQSLKVPIKALPKNEES